MRTGREIQVKAEKFNPVIVDYSNSQLEMIKAGNYDWSNNLGDFPLHGRGHRKVELYLVHFDKNVTNSEAEKCMNEQGFEPAKVEHLLSLGATFPEKQNEFTIVAIGTDWFDSRGNRVCPFLSRNADGKRILDIYLDIEGEYDDKPWWDDSLIEWNSSTRFLALRK